MLDEVVILSRAKNPSRRANSLGSFARLRMTETGMMRIFETETATNLVKLL
jgi:hypothetical protein